MKHGFIGFGHLVKAIHEGLKKDPENQFFYVTKQSEHPGVQKLKNVKELVESSRVIWLGIKPQHLVEVLEEMKGLAFKDKVIVSPVAGKQIALIEEYLGKEVNVIRIMPNLAIAYQRSVTAFCANHPSSLADKIKTDLEKLGRVVELPEKHFDLFTALFASGPAFLLEILKVFKSGMEEMELSDHIMNDLLVGLLIGTTDYFHQNADKKDFKTLVQNITSKGGTTEAGLKSFHQSKLDVLFEEVILAAKHRSEEMSK